MTAIIANANARTLIFNVMRHVINSFTDRILHVIDNCDRIRKVDLRIHLAMRTALSFLSWLLKMWVQLSGASLLLHRDHFHWSPVTRYLIHISDWWERRIIDTHFRKLNAESFMNLTKRAISSSFFSFNRQGIDHWSV